MTILVINPNSTQAMTEALEEETQCLANMHHPIIFETCLGSPASIEGFTDGALATFELIKLVQQYEADASLQPDAYVIACFDDTGLNAVRELTQKPVLGIGESAMHAASLLCYRFCIMTTLQRSVPIIEQNLTEYGLSARCNGVFASDIPVLQLDSDPHAYEKVLAKARENLLKSHSEALILGCAGMSHWAEKMAQTLEMPVLDGFRIALKFCQALVDLKLQTSKVNAFKRPESKIASSTK